VKYFEFHITQNHPSLIDDIMISKEQKSIRAKYEANMEETGGDY
jgi:hypothetical protein